MKDLKSRKFSFIIPVYNAEKYLRQCLDSILNQDISKDDYELICINDGSTDNSLNILEEYEAREFNIKLIKNKISGGVSSARNLGLRHAVGEYIWFVDSDDAIRENCLGQIDKLINKYDPVVLNISFSTLEFNEKNAPLETLNFELVEEKPHFVETVWRAIVKRNIIVDNGINFNKDLKFSEDALFNFYYCLYATGRSIDIKDQLYYYRQHETSSIKRMGMDSKISDILEVGKQIKSAIDNGLVVDCQLKQATQKVRWCVYTILRLLPQSSLNYKKTMKALKVNNLSLPAFWIPHVKVSGIKGKMKRCFMRLLSVKPIYFIYFKVVRFSHNKNGK